MINNNDADGFLNNVIASYDKMKNDEDDFLNGLIANDEMVNSGLLVADEN